MNKVKSAPAAGLLSGLAAPAAVKGVPSSLPAMARIHLNHHVQMKGLLILLLLAAQAVSAKDIYIAQSALGAGTGADAADARAVTFFNSSANWGSGSSQISPGDTVHLVGTMTSALSVQASGTAGNVITIHGEPGSIFSAPVLPGTVINIGSQSYITVDSVNMACTANGNGLANDQAITGVNASGGSYVTVQNCTFTNTFVRVYNSADAANGGTAISFANVNHLVARNNIGYQCGTIGIGVGRNGQQLVDWQIYSNNIYGCNMGVQGWDNTSSGVNGVYIYNNRIEGGYLWDGATSTIEATYHHNGIYLWAENAGSTMANIFVYNNVFGPNVGKAGQCSSTIFFSCSGTPGAISNLWIYNNVLYSVGNTAMDALMFIWGPQKVRIYNNSIYGGSDSNGIRIFSGSDVELLNNICSLPNLGPIYDDGTTAISVCNSNVWNGNDAIYWGGGWESYSAWQGSGYDANTILADPKFNSPTTGDLTLQSTSPAIGKGANLSAYFTTDAAGHARPASGAWDIGAYQSGSAVGGSPAIAVTPASQNFGSVLVGSSSNLSFTVQNTGTATLSGSASVGPPFSIISGATYSLGAGQSQTVTVQYSPAATGANTQTVTFTGAAGATAAVTGSGYTAAGPAITVSPGSQSFGSVLVGTSATQNFTVKNTGAGTLAGSASVAAPFSVISGASYSLAAGQSQTVTVQFSPTVAGTSTQTVTFTGGAGATATVTGSTYTAPVANADSYSVAPGTPLVVAAPGVLANDTGGSGTLTAAQATGPGYGSLTLNSNGSFTYTPNAGFAGTDSFTYTAISGQGASSPATVTITVAPSSTLFSDAFSSGTLSPWTQESGTWTVANGVLSGTGTAGNYSYAYISTNWTNYSVQAQIQFPAGGYGGGIGGRLNLANGAHYGVWVFPEGSSGGSAVIKLMKFTGWTTWTGSAMAQASLTKGVGTTWHTVLVTFQGANITVSVDGTQEISVTDSNFGSVAPFAGGGITAELGVDQTPFTMGVENVVVTGALPAPPTALHVLSSSP